MRVCILVFRKNTTESIYACVCLFGGGGGKKEGLYINNKIIIIIKAGKKATRKHTRMKIKHIFIKRLSPPYCLQRNPFGFV